MVSSVPIGCTYYIDDNPRVTRVQCRSEMKLFVDDRDPLECVRSSVLNTFPKEDVIENQKCSKYFEVRT